MNSAIRTVFLAVGPLCLLAIGSGCTAPYLGPNTPFPTPPTTYWNKLGIPQAGAALRDNFLNRRGNFPKLEAKPPVLRLADPRNLAEGQPEMLKSAAKIKMAEDMKKQKLKALKYLAEVNCGCYNDDGKVEKAFLEALADCDPDVRLAAVKGLTEAASCSSSKGCKLCKKGGDKKHCMHGLLKCGACQHDGSNCCDSCRTTCCTRKLQDKLQEVAYGQTDDCCFKEPVAEIRAAAEQLLCLCPPAAELEPEELILPAPHLPEELLLPEALKKPNPLNIEEGKKPAEGTGSGPQSMRLSDTGLQQYVSTARGATATLSDNNSGVPEVLAGRRAVSSNAAATEIANPDLLVSCNSIKYNRLLGELLVEMPYASQLQVGWQVVLLDGARAQHFGTISDVGGRRVLITMSQADQLMAPEGMTVSLGVVAQ